MGPGSRSRSLSSGAHSRDPLARLSVTTLDRFQFFKQPRHKSASPRHRSPGLCADHPRKTEGAGNAGCADRTHSLTCAKKKAHERSHHRYAASTGIPRAMVLTVSFVLSPVTGLFCHRHLTHTSAKLDASVGASGPHDFAVRAPVFAKGFAGLESAEASAKAVTGVARLASPPRPPHPASTSVTIAKRPSYRGGTARNLMLIWV